MFQGTENMEAHFPNVTHVFERERAPQTTCPTSSIHSGYDFEDGTSEVRERPPPTLLFDNNQIDSPRNNKVSRSPGEHTLSLSSATINVINISLIIQCLVSFIFVRLV